MSVFSRRFIEIIEEKEETLKRKKSLLKAHQNAAILEYVVRKYLIRWLSMKIISFTSLYKILITRIWFSERTKESLQKD